MSNKEVLTIALRFAGLSCLLILALLPVFWLTAVFGGGVGLCIGLPLGLFLACFLLVKLGGDLVQEVLGSKKK